MKSKMIPKRCYRRSYLTTRLSGNLTSKLHEGEQLIFDPHTPRPQVGMRDLWDGRGEGESRRWHERVFHGCPYHEERICPFGVHVTS